MSNMSKKTALVTGGAGFIGSHIVDALIKKNYRVVVVDDLSTGDTSRVHPKAEFAHMSITDAAFADLLKEVAPEVVFHAAAQVNVRTSVLDPMTDARVNVLGTLNIVQHAKEAGVERIVFSSSGGAMFSDAVRPPYAESQTPAPVSPYGISKLAGEEYLAFAQAAYGIKTVVLRYANVYGPRQDAKGEAGVISIFGKQLLANAPVMINGTGKQTRDFVFVTDVVKANMLALKPNAHGVYHIGTGVETSVNSLCTMMKKTARSTSIITHGPAQAGEVRRSALVSKRAKKELGWVPKTSLEQGIKKTLQSMKAAS